LVENRFVIANAEPSRVCWLKTMRFDGRVEVARGGMTRQLATTLRSALLPLSTATCCLALRRGEAAA
jgi:hypothetical protein